MSFHLDYDHWIPLDAEDLAETGIGDAYESLLPELQKHAREPVPIQEVIDDDVPRYSVRAGAEEYVIYAPELDGQAGNGWDRATFALFDIINAQLAGSEYRFFAINGGNELGGMFLTPAQAQAARKTLSKKTDWPYLPEDKPPWYGQYH